MADDDPLAGQAPLARRRRWPRQAALAGAAAVVALAGAAWIERRSLATRAIDGILAKDGVPARYTIDRLALGRQSLTDVVIGDPTHPDLVADRIETVTAVGPGGVRLVGLRIGRARLRAQLVDGRLSLGAIDRLLAQNSGGGGALPAIDLAVTDARLRVETPAGAIGVALAGQGRLDGGFRGRATVIGERLAAANCVAQPPRATLAIGARGGRVALAGPIASAAIRCGTARWQAPRAVVDLTLDPAAGSVTGQWQVAGGAVVYPQVRAAALAGSGTLALAQGRATGQAALSVREPRGHGAAARRLSFDGRYAAGGGDPRIAGQVAITGGRWPLALGRRIAGLAGTPLGPLAARAAGAIDTGSRRFDGTARIDAASGGVAVDDGALVAANGMTVRFGGMVRRGGAIAARLAVSGGGGPTLAVSLSRASAGATLRGSALMQRYAVARARLALTPIGFAVAPGGAAHAVTTATLSGPLGADGRVAALTVPLRLRRDAGGVIRLGEACVPVGFDSLAAGGVRLGATWLRLCPEDDAIVRVANGAVGGGVRLGGIDLHGRLGATPLAIRTGGASARIAPGGFVIRDLAVVLGEGANPTRLDAATLTGSLTGGGLGGHFGGGGGRIGAVPLALSGAAGEWRVAGGVLTLGGALDVADAAASATGCPAGIAAPRFCPMRATGVALTLADDRIDATGILVEPVTGTRVAGVHIAHDLASGDGHADLTVDRLTFAKGFQPDRLTPVTTGVVADVAGTVTGRGRIDWRGGAVTSSGRFATEGLDLAAAFGPVTGIAGEIRFTDLLGLVTAPAQRLTVASINPGVLVERGEVAYHLEPGSKVAVESARWPFAGGTLTLDPTLLDFAAPSERHLTFRLDGIAADRFIEQFDFKNLAATGTFDGVLPMVFDAAGGRIDGGHLTVREGGGSLAYVGDLSQKQLGFWGNLAFQALRSLRYRSLDIQMNGPLDGEIVTAVRFAGISQGKGARTNFLIRRLQRLPFVFNVRITAPFRTLLDGLDPARQAQLHLQELIDAERGRTPVQPPASETPP